LAAKAGTAGSYGWRSTPGSVCESSDDYTVAVACWAQEAGFDNGENSKSLRFQLAGCLEE
jgi:hypothetical protein